MKKQTPAPKPELIEKKPAATKNMFFLASLCVIFLISFTYIFNSKLDLNGDNFSYLTLAKAIAQGDGYSGIYSQGMPPASHFPPGYSAILAVFMFFKINSIVFFKILNGLFFLGATLLLYWMMNKITGNRTFAWVMSVLILLNVGLLTFATIIMSEIPYLFFTCLALYALYKLADRPDFWKSPYFYVLVASATLTYYLRTIGIVLIIAVIIHYLISKRWKVSLAFAASFFILYLPWIIRNKMYGIEGRYFGTVMTVNPWRPEEGTISTFGELVQKMIANFDETVIKGFKEVLFPFMEIDYATPSGFLGVVGGLLILALVFYGAWNMGKFRYLFILYILGNIGTFMLWHGGNGARYVYPLTPFVVYFFFWGVLSLVLRAKAFKSVANYLPYAFLLFAFGMINPLKNLHQVSKSPYPPAYANYFDIAKELGKRPASEKAANVVSSRKPAMFSYFSECVSVSYLYSLNPNEVIQKLIDDNVNYVVLEQLGYSSTPRYLYPAIVANQDLFMPEIHLPNPDTYLLRFNREKAIEKLKNAPAEAPAQPVQPQ